MPFKLSKGGTNVIGEVQRWQYFLLKRRIGEVGRVDGDFGTKTETATKFFQVSQQITATGKLDERTLEIAKALGYTVLPDDYYSKRATEAFPPKPTNLDSPSNSSRNRDFMSFKFLQKPLANRPDKEAIVIKGSCDGSLADWTVDKIIDVEIPQLQFAKGYFGRFRTHKKAAAQFQALFKAWEDADLLHLIMTYEGCFVPRYKRRQAPPGNSGHGQKCSKDVPELSNHSFGSAFDINAGDNPLGSVPALCGRRGATRELVEAAQKIGIYWGGHFNDGMHFEISKLA